MEETNVVVCDEDLQYAKSLVQIFQRANQFMANYTILSEKEKVVPHLSEGNAQLYLLSEKIYEEVVREFCNTLTMEERKHVEQRLVVITEDANIKYEGIMTVFKYQPASLILDLISGRMLKVLNKEMKNHRNAKIYAVLSIGNTDTSSLIGHMIAKEYSRHYHVLLVNMEVFPFLYGQQKTQYTLSDYIYAVVTKSEMAEQIAEGMQYRNGELRCISPIRSFPDLYELGSEEVATFLEQMKEISQVDIIIIVLDFLQPFTMSLLTVCNRVITTESHNLVESRKQEQFYSMLALEEKEWIQDKITYCNITPEYLLENITEEGELTDGLRANMQNWLKELLN